MGWNDKHWGSTKQYLSFAQLVNDFFQALVKSDKVNLADLPESGDTIATALRLIDDGQYADSRLLIPMQRPHQGVCQHFFSNL